MHKYIDRLKARISLNKWQFAVYSVLRFLVILTGIRCLLTHNYESMALCILSLALFLLPSFFEERLNVYIPALFQVIIYLFIFSAEILGEVNKFYTAIPGWDTMLHTLNGFLCGALGLSLVFIVNKADKDKLHLSPFYLAAAAFCFSMTIGVLWEFFEYSADRFLYLDMQKDTVVSDFGSVYFDDTHSQIPVRISDIDKTVVETEDGDTYVIEGGYLDVGINDTMKDLFVNFLGAAVFSILGYFYEKMQDKHSPVAKLMIKPMSEDERKEAEKLIDDRISGRKGNRSKKEKHQESRKIERN